MQPRTFTAVVVMSLVLGAIGGFAATQRSANEQTSSGTVASRRMADGKEWTTTNLNVNVQPSYCYDDADALGSRFFPRGGAVGARIRIGRDPKARSIRTHPRVCRT
jgi:hypothetical protein